MFSFSRRNAISAVIISFTTLGLTGCDRIPDTIKIGVIHPMTGDRAAIGQDLFNGVKMAAEEINKAGFKINGKPVTIELIMGDDKGTVDAGKEAAQKLVDQDVVAVIGHYNSGISIATAPIYAAKNIPQLAISTNPKFTQLDLPTTFRTVGNDTLQASAIASFASSELGGSKYAVIASNSSYGKGLGDGIVAGLKKANKTIVVNSTVAEKTVAFDELAAQIKQAGVETIVTSLSDFQAIALSESLAKVTYTNVNMIGGDDTFSANMLKAGKNLKGLYATSPVLSAIEYPNGAKFVEKYRATFKIDPFYGSHYTYDAMYVLSDAIKKAGSVDPAKITGTLRNFNGFAPVTGTMSWDGVGEQRYGTVGVYVERGGKWELQQRSDRW
jgi:branched-chain amino acid transport system substrate-binding protein